MMKLLTGKHIRIFAIPALLLGAALAVSVTFTDSYITKRKVNKTKEELRTGGVAILSFFVDCCCELSPDRGNAFPKGITTPIAYISNVPRDRFSPDGEPVRYFNQPGRNNGTMFIVASRGPDGDWDFDRLPLKKNFLPLDWDNFDVPSDIDDLLDENKRYITNKGVDVTDEVFEGLALPFDGKEISPYPILNNYLAQNGIAIYDPTNGVYSDGDMIFSNIP